MNSNILDLRRHLRLKVPKGQRFKKPRSRIEKSSLVAQTSWTTTSSPTRESPLIAEAMSKPDPLSRLLSFPNTVLNGENASRHSLRLRESFSSEAQKLKETLITNLISMSIDDDNNLDVEFMIDLANVAFASLKSLHASFGDLYDAVKSFIHCHHKLLETKIELEKNGCIPHMLLHKADLAKRTRDVANAQKKAKTALAQSWTDAVNIYTRVDKTRVMLSRLEKKLDEDNSKVQALQIESDKVGKSKEEAKSEYQDVAKKIEEMKATEEEIIARQDRAKVRIDSTRVKLAKLYLDELDN